MINIWKLNKQTLVLEYIIYWMMVLGIMLLSMVYLVYINFQTFEQRENHILSAESHKIQKIFDEKITYTDHILKFVGSKIRDLKIRSPQLIEKVVLTHRKTFRDEIFSWHKLHYITNKYSLIADSHQGILKKPISIFPDIRPWLKKAQSDCWKLKFSQPTHGLITDEYIIPAGIAMCEKDKGNVIGYLAVGINIDHFTSNLINVLGDNVIFAIFDSNGSFITSSELQMESYDFKLPSYLLNQGGAEGLKINDIKLDNNVFTNLIDSQKYPFKILVGYKHSVYMENFKQDVISKLSVYIVLGVILSGLLIFIAIQSIKPLIELSKAADNISKGQPFALKKYNAYELKVLAEQLENISQINADLRYKQQMLTNLNEDIQKANEFIKSNMSFLSHELINPISTIIGFSEIINQKIKITQDQDAIEISEMLIKISKYQHRQLNFFLKLFKFQEAGKVLEIKLIDLRNAIEWNLSMVTHHLKEKSITISLDIESNLKMMGDEIMIGQLIQNLISNAAKYNKVGGHIKVVGKSKGTNKILLEFTDNGIGIDEDNLSKIFKMFERANCAVQKNAIIGYGLGLTYAQQCAIAHGGQIKVKSKKNIGSTFSVELKKGIEV